MKVLFCKTIYATRVTTLREFTILLHTDEENMTYEKQRTCVLANARIWLWTLLNKFNDAHDDDDDDYGTLLRCTRVITDGRQHVEEPVLTFC